MALEALWAYTGRPIVRALIFNEEERVLLIQRGPGLEEKLWCVPGGKVDGPEHPDDAVRREVLEEVGLPFTPVLFGGVSEIGRDERLYVVVYYGGALEGTPHIDNVEAVDLDWPTLDEVLHRTDLAFNGGQGLKSVCEGVLNLRLVPKILGSGHKAAHHGSKLYK